MTDPDACCRQLMDIKGGKSPFDRLIAFGWSDGPTEGFVSCGRCGRDFHFEMLADWAGGDGVDDIRVFRLAPLAEGSLTSLEEVLSVHQSPRWPVWMPIWAFPTDAVRAEINRKLDRISETEEPAIWVIATPNLTEKIAEARAATTQDLLAGAVAIGANFRLDC